MSLLILTQNLYREFRRERPATDAAVLQLREFLTFHFGHEGTKAYQTVDETTSTRQIETAGARTLKRFVHPLAAGRHAQPRKQETPVVLIDGAGLRTEEGTVIPLPETVVGAGGADDLGKPLILPENQPSIFPESAAVPVVDRIDLSEVSEMKPKAVAGKYSREQIIATLEQYQIPFKEDGSNTQLAAALIQFAVAKTAK